MEIPEEYNLRVNLPPGCVKMAAESVGIPIDPDALDHLEHEVQRHNETMRLKMKAAEMSKHLKYKPELNVEETVVEKQDANYSTEFCAKTL